jgi:hypothetical protein
MSHSCDIVFTDVISEAAMVRTVISLDEDDKRWLDDEAAREGVAMTEVVRRAVRQLRTELEHRSDFEALLAATAGAGTGEDGLDVQRRLRDEWEQRPS